jgi:transposase
MLSPTGWWLVTAPVDLRCGMDRLLVHVRESLGSDPFDGAAYVFRNRAATRIKVLCCDAQGIWLAVRRLQEGRFRWPTAGEATWSLTPQQFAWLCAGVDWQRLSSTPGLARRV